jgi:3-methyladenine DNA glycosylase AlkD
MADTVPELLAELAALEDPRAREVNERNGDDHGVNLGKLRAIAKRLKTQHELALELVAKQPERLDLPGLLDLIEAGLVDAPERKQWAMNHCLAQIGISHPALRDRALAIGERLEVLKDYPTPPGCTSPFAPAWIGEIVRRQELAAAGS